MGARRPRWVPSSVTQEPPAPADTASDSATPDPDLSPRPIDGPEATPDRRTRKADDPLRGSRTSGVWVGATVFGVVLVLLVVFVVQNTQQVTVSYFGWTGTAPLAVTLLIATAGGILLTAAAGTLRILQLRRRVRRVEKAHR